MSNTIIGIDLGTTNSEIAFIQEDGTPQVLEIEGSPLVPSVVGFSENGELLVGQKALNQLVLYPERTIKSIKRKMGKNEDIKLAEETYTPQEISAMILRYLKQAAEKQLGQAIQQAVITVPAYFSDIQRQATKDAGELAGLEVLRIINEPTAASLAYESQHSEAKNILVYDLGGGTFDVSVVKKQEDIIEVLSSHGNNHLGGDDFDNLIVEHILAELETQHSVDARNNLAAMARIRQAAEKAKIALSNAPFVQINEEFLLKKKRGLPVHLTMELSRQDYEKMIEPMLQETLDSVHISIKDAGLTVADIDEILLVGGSTRTPLIQTKLEAILKLKPRSEINPDLCVVTGAAIQAAVIAGQSVANVLVDVTPYTFGTSVLDILDGVEYPFVYVPLIQKNTPIPVSNSDVFYTVVDNQAEIKVDAFQGEDRDAMNNIPLGEFNIQDLSKVPSGNKIIITFTLDINGILKVTAVEKATGLEKSITIDNAMTQYNGEDMVKAKSRINQLMEETHLDNKPAIEATSSEYTLIIQKAEALLETVDNEDKEDLIDAIEDLKDAVNENDTDAMEQHKSTLVDLLYYLDN